MSTFEKENGNRGKVKNKILMKIVLMWHLMTFLLNNMIMLIPCLFGGSKGYFHKFVLANLFLFNMSLAFASLRFRLRHIVYMRCNFNKMQSSFNLDVKVRDHIMLKVTRFKNHRCVSWRTPISDFDNEKCICLPTRKRIHSPTVY